MEPNLKILNDYCVTILEFRNQLNCIPDHWKIGTIDCDEECGHTLIAYNPEISDMLDQINHELYDLLICYGINGRHVINLKGYDRNGDFDGANIEFYLYLEVTEAFINEIENQINPSLELELFKNEFFNKGPLWLPIQRLEELDLEISELFK